MTKTADKPEIPVEPPEQEAAPGVRLRVSEDQVQVLLEAVDPLADPHACVMEIRTACEDLKLPEIPGAENLREFLVRVAKPDEDLTGELLIMGRPPEPPRDGQLVWARDFFRQGWEVDPETGSVNFWEHLERPGVVAGEEICRVIPPVPGKAGLTVFDQPITVRKPRAEKLRTGKNVEVTEEPDGTRILKAACNGRVRHALGVVTVDDLYVIKGDVCLETGNIHHTGSVSIQGDVKAGALLEVAGDVVVQGLVETSTIRCGGTLTVHGGIVGDGTGTVDADGEVHALYVNEARISCRGSLVVQNEITHSEITCHGEVLVTAGRIAGGRTVALGGIQVAVAGAKGSTGTVLIAGRDPALEANIADLRGRLPRLERARARLQAARERYRPDPDAAADEQRRTAEELQAKHDEVEEAIAQLKAEVDHLKQRASAHAVAEILVFRELWSGTTVQLGDAVGQVRKSVPKPRRIRRTGGDVSILPMAGDDEMVE
jgi:uncharacterized protein (DUF342 family)